MQGQTTDEAPTKTLTKTSYADERMSFDLDGVGLSVDVVSAAGPVVMVRVYRQVALGCIVLCGTCPRLTFGFWRLTIGSTGSDAASTLDSPS